MQRGAAGTETDFGFEFAAFVMVGIYDLTILLRQKVNHRTLLPVC